MVTFLDLIKDIEFRKFSSNRLSVGTGNFDYFFPDILPPLYKYTRIEDYVIDNIINNQISATRIGEFNDLFDGAFHQYGTLKEREDFAQKEWEKMEKLRILAKLPKMLEEDYYVDIRKKHLKKESRLKFRELDYLNTFVCCFSTQNNSTLMWSHYAASNTGICIEYNFNLLSEESIIRNSIFPVAYSNLPVNLQDLLDDKNHKVFQYSLDSAVLCAALNKANVWKYEQEWRMVLVLAPLDQKGKWISLCAPAPSSVIFGYHFLKPFFYYNDNKLSGNAKESIKKTKKLLEYLEKNKIPVAIMRPMIGKYELFPQPIAIQSLIDLINQNFNHDEPEDMRYYYVIHDQLMELLDNE